MTEVGEPTKDVLHLRGVHALCRKLDAEEARDRVAMDRNLPPEADRGRDVDDRTVTLYRPVGQAELDLIRESGWRAFPPRFARQPIFYPVLSERYAAEIAERWNTRDQVSGYIGYVTRFSVRASFLAEYAVQTVGASYHQESGFPPRSSPR